MAETGVAAHEFQLPPPNFSPFGLACSRPLGLLLGALITSAMGKNKGRKATKVGTAAAVEPVLSTPVTGTAGTATASSSSSSVAPIPLSASSLPPAITDTPLSTSTDSKSGSEASTITIRSGRPSRYVIASGRRKEEPELEQLTWKSGGVPSIHSVGSVDTVHSHSRTTSALSLPPPVLTTSTTVDFMPPAAVGVNPASASFRPLPQSGPQGSTKSSRSALKSLQVQWNADKEAQTKAYEQKLAAEVVQAASRTESSNVIVVAADGSRRLGKVRRYENGSTSSEINGKSGGAVTTDGPIDEDEEKRVAKEAVVGHDDEIEDVPSGEESKSADPVTREPKWLINSGATGLQLNEQLLQVEQQSLLAHYLFRSIYYSKQVLGYSLNFSRLVLPTSIGARIPDIVRSTPSIVIDDNFGTPNPIRRLGDGSEPSGSLVKRAVREAVVLGVAVGLAGIFVAGAGAEVVWEKLRLPGWGAIGRKTREDLKEE